jgi:hypothetical protein
MFLPLKYHVLPNVSLSGSAGACAPNPRANLMHFEERVKKFDCGHKILNFLKIAINLRAMLWCLLGFAQGLVKLGMGGVSTKQNPLLFDGIPGFHSCASKTFKLIPSALENLVMIDFRRSKQIEHCSLVLTPAITEQWRKLAIDDAFLRFSIDGVVKRVPFIDPSTSDPYIFTEFLFTLSENLPFQGIVQPQQSYLLKENATMTIIFTLSYAKFDYLAPSLIISRLLSSHLGLSFASPSLS